MKDQNPIRTARRKLRMEDRLGSNAFCLFCGYACLESLTFVTRRWLEGRGTSRDWIDRLLEEHHVLGEAHDPDLTVTLCLNCHRKITEGLAREGVSMYPVKDLQMLTALKLRASAVFFESLAISYRELANLLGTHLENK